MARKLIEIFNEVMKLWILCDNILILKVLEAEKNKK